MAQLKPHQNLRLLRLLLFHDQTCTMRPLLAPLPIRFEQKETKATKSEIAASWSSIAKSPTINLAPRDVPRHAERDDCDRVFKGPSSVRLVAVLRNARETRPTTWKTAGKKPILK